MNKTKYEDLALSVRIVAATVCEQEYLGQEFSSQIRHSVDRIEALRKQMTPEQVDEFATLCDARCRSAYESNFDWFMKCVRGGNAGRDQLYTWVRHWLAAYLMTPNRWAG